MRDVIVGGDAPPDASGVIPGLFPGLLRGRIGHWRLDESAGTRVADSSEKGNHGQTVGITNEDWRPARVRNGLNFTRARRTVVTVGAHESLNPTAELSLALWVNARNWTGRPCLFQKGDAAGQYGLGAVDGQLEFHVRLLNGQIVRVSMPVPPANQWVHIVASYDGQNAQLFVNGNPVARTVAAGRPAPGPADLTLGGRPQGAPEDEFFDGLLDEVVLYDRMLTFLEIALHAAASGP
jgi:hypothetical protein